MSKKHKFTPPSTSGKGNWKDDFDYYKSPSGGQRCYHTHPALKLPNSDLVIYGGSCITPSVKDADVYIGFDRGMTLRENFFPWEGKLQVLHPITDMSVPDDIQAFKKVLAFAKQQLIAGKKVHCGCIGGHGRTGTFFAALVSTFDEPDAINYVRKNYCQKAVESQSQIDWLHDHFGITKAAPAKGGVVHSSKSQHDFGFYKHPVGTGSVPVHTGSNNTVGGSLMVFDPIKSAASIWKQ